MKNCHSPQSRVCIFLSFDKTEGHAYLAVLLRWWHINCLKLLSVTYAESSKSSKQEPYFKDCNIYSLQNLKNNIGCLVLGVFSRHSILFFQVQAYLCIFYKLKNYFVLPCLLGTWEYVGSAASHSVIARALFYIYLDLKEEFMNFKPRMAVYLVCNCESLYMQVWVCVLLTKRNQLLRLF